MCSMYSTLCSHHSINSDNAIHLVEFCWHSGEAQISTKIVNGLCQIDSYIIIILLCVYCMIWQLDHRFLYGCTYTIITVSYSKPVVYQWCGSLLMLSLVIGPSPPFLLQGHLTNQKWTMVTVVNVCCMCEFVCMYVWCVGMHVHIYTPL